MSGTLNSLLDAYLAWADSYYRKHERPSRTAANIRSALAEFRQLFGSMPTSEFKPRHLMELQQHLDNSGRMNRRTVNERINWVRHMFSWAARLELVDDLLPHRLKLVSALRPGRCRAKEGKGVRPATWEQVSATMAVAPLKISTMIEIQWHTGMRPCELVRLAKSRIFCEQAESGEPRCWFEPDEHKSEHRGRVRRVALGPVAMGLIHSWLPRAKGDWLFPGKLAGQPMRALSYYREIDKVNRRHGITRWSPNQIRHAVATRVERAAGLEAARAVLGHASARTTQIYVERDQHEATRAMASLG